MAEWKKVIVSGSTANLAGLTLSGAVNAGTDTDKFLVLDSSGNVDFRTGAEVLSDIGAGTGGGDITEVTAGDGLTGGATTGAATLNVGAGDGISVAADAVAVDATVLRTTGGGVVSGSAQILLGGDLSGTADSATVTAVQGVSLTSGEATQLANIDSTTISSTQWGYLGVMDQAVQTSDSVTFASVTSDGGIIGNQAGTTRFTFDSSTGITTIATASVEQNLTVGGNLYVNGTTTAINSTNLNIEDKFVLLNSGSAGSPSYEGGIIVESGSVAGTGNAFYYDASDNRWALKNGLSSANTAAVTADAFMGIVLVSAIASVNTGSSYYKPGTIIVDNQDFYIVTV